MWLEVYSGLASRCLTLAEAYYLMQSGRGGKRLTVVWPITQECKIHFYEVFDRDIFSDINFRVIEVKFDRKEINTNGGVFHTLKNGDMIKAFHILCAKLNRELKEKFFKIKISSLRFGKKYYDYNPPIEIRGKGEKHIHYIENTWLKLKNDLSENFKGYVHAYCGMIKDDEQEKVDYSVIKFKPEYWSMVDHIFGNKKECVGIHIRRTDHMVAIEGSGTEAFIKQIDKILGQDKKTVFFLATDDENEEKKLQELYGDKILVQRQKKWGRASKEEMQSGIVDLLCLSNCKYILGSYTSVFSHFSARYGGKELIICKNEE